MSGLLSVNLKGNGNNFYILRLLPHISIFGNFTLSEPMTHSFEKVKLYSSVLLVFEVCRSMMEAKVPSSKPSQAAIAFGLLFYFGEQSSRMRHTWLYNRGRRSKEKGGKNVP